MIRNQPDAVAWRSQPGCKLSRVKAKPVLEVIGTLSSAFDFGWDGNLDDTSGTIGGIANYSISTAEGKKVLNLGLEFAKR